MNNLHLLLPFCCSRGHPPRLHQRVCDCLSACLHVSGMLYGVVVVETMWLTSRQHKDSACLLPCSLAGAVLVVCRSVFDVFLDLVGCACGWCVPPCLACLMRSVRKWFIISIKMFKTPFSCLCKQGCCYCCLFALFSVCPS